MPGMRQDSRHRRRRTSSGRFFWTALIAAVVIFLMVKLTEGWRPWATSPKPTPTPSSATAAIAEAADSLKGLQVFLKRGGCNGGCPYYALMYKKGTLKYVGVHDVKKQGVVTEPFLRDEQRALLKQVQDAAFFNLGKSYDLKSPACKAKRIDAPTFTVGVTLNGQTKVVKVNEACTNVPSVLRRLARGIDETTHSAQWTGIVQAPVASTAK